MLAIINKTTGEVINLYTLPLKEDGTPYTVNEITTTDDVEIRTVADNAKVGDIV